MGRSFPDGLSMVITSEERPGLRERQRQARGEAILDAAFALIVEQGYDALTMEALAARLGISRQTLYYHFASRDEIALRAIITLVDQGIAVIQSYDHALSPIERLKGIVRWMIETRFEPTRAALVKVKHSLMPFKAHPDYQRAFDRRADALAKVIEAAQSEGELRADIPSGLIVQMLLGLVSDASYEPIVASGEASLEQVIDAIIGVFFNGLRP